MRSLVLGLAALAFAATASAASKPAQGPYTLDDKGRCRAANGAAVVPRLCHVLPDRCKDPKTGKFVKCSTKGAVPA